MIFLKHQLNTIATFSEFKELSDNAKAGISFWGYSHIKVESYKGAVHIDSLLKKFNLLLTSNTTNEEDLYLPILKKSEFSTKVMTISIKKETLLRKFFGKLENLFQMPSPYVTLTLSVPNGI